MKNQLTELTEFIYLEIANEEACIGCWKPPSVATGRKKTVNEKLQYSCSFVRLYTLEYIIKRCFTQTIYSCCFQFCFFSSRGSALFIHPGLNAERGKCSRKIVKNWWHKCNVAHLPPSSAPVAYQEFLGSEANWRFKMRQVLLNFRLLKKRSSESLWRLQS